MIDCHLSLHGTDGKLELDGDYAGLAIAGDRFRYPWAPVGRRDRYGRLSHPIYAPITHFVDCVADDLEPAASFHDGYVATVVIDAIVRAVKQGGPVPVALDQRR